MPGRTYQNTLGVPYQYQGIEKDPETNLLNFELRQYDARLGRWFNPDPYGQFHSPYLAMGNNPISSVDPDGGWSYDQFFNSSSAPNFGGMDSYNFATDNSTDGNTSQSMGHPDADIAAANNKWMSDYMQSGAFWNAKSNYEKYVTSHTNSKGQWGSWKTSNPKFDGPVDYFKVDESFVKENPLNISSASAASATFGGGLKFQKLSYDNLPWYRTRADVWASNSMRSAWNSVIDLPGVVKNLFSYEGIKNLYNAPGNMIVDGVKWLIFTDNGKKASDAVSASEDIAGMIILGKATIKMQPKIKYFQGTEKPWTKGATPNSVYTYMSSDGKALSNSVYNSKGKVKARVDFVRTGDNMSGHAHIMKIPGNPASGQHFALPYGEYSKDWVKLPSGVQPKIPFRQ